MMPSTGEAISLEELAAIAAPTQCKESLAELNGYANAGEIKVIERPRAVRLNTCFVTKFSLDSTSYRNDGGMLEGGRLKKPTQPVVFAATGPERMISPQEALKIAALEEAAGRWSPEAWAFCGGKPPSQYLTAQGIARLADFSGRYYRRKGSTGKPQGVEIILTQRSRYKLPEEITKPKGQGRGFDVEMFRDVLSRDFEEVKQETPVDRHPLRAVTHRIK